MCYSDLPYLYTGRGFVEVNWPYSDDAQVRARYEVMEYPVGISYWAWATAGATHWLNGSPDLEARYATPVDELSGQADVRREKRIFVVVNALGFAVLALLSAWLLAGVNPRRPWDAAAFALSPALLLTGLVNWDLIAVVFVAGALWAWARGRPVLTGVLIGLGTAVKLYPLFLLGGVLVICLRQRRFRALDPHRRSRPSWRGWSPTCRRTSPDPTSGGSSGPSTPSAAPTSARSGWSCSRRWTTRQPVHLRPAHHQPGLLAVLRRLVRRRAAARARAPATPRLAQLGFLIVAGFLVINKVYSPQYVLWLLPLAVLARPRWRDLLIWQAGEVVYFAAVWWYLGGYLAPAGGGDAGFYWAATLVRIAAELYLVAIVVRDVGARHDPVRRATPRAGRRSGDQHPVERGRGVADPHVDLVADLGHPRAARQEQHRGLHVRRLGEEPLLAVDRERRAHEPGRVETAARQRRGAGLEPGVAGRGLEADAVRRTAADHQDVAGLRGGAVPVAEGVAALHRVHVEDGRGDGERARGRRARARCRREAGR